MRIAVMGAGGLGGYFGARLCLGGADVHFIARGKHLQAMQQDEAELEKPAPSASVGAEGGEASAEDLAKQIAAAG